MHELVLPNGLKGLVIDTPKTGVVVAEVSFRAGEFLLKKEKWETAHLMEHVLLGANKYFKKARDFQAAIEQNSSQPRTVILDEKAKLIFESPCLHHPCW